jgi:hypothetical protein
MTRAPRSQVKPDAERASARADGAVPIELATAVL